MSPVISMSRAFSKSSSGSPVARAARRTRSLGLRGINARTAQSLRLRGLTEPVARAQDALFDQLVTDRGPEDADQLRGLLRLLRENRARGHFGGQAHVPNGPFGSLSDVVGLFVGVVRGS